MSHQRILQISDLHIDRSPRTAAVLKMVKRTLEESGLLPLDYLVVCGNLTKNGRPEEFRRAAVSLAHFAEQVLKGDDEVSQANRLMVVPGDRDVSRSRESAPLYHFNRFCDAVRTALHAGPTQQPLLPDRPVVRRLKDLTLIGVSYWQGASAAALKKGIRAAAKDGSVVAYHSAKPTILASSQSPLMELGARRSLDELKSVLEIDLRIDFHLFGTAPVVLVTLEPFAFQHVGISTGPRVAGSAWPLRFNILEIGPTSHASADPAALRGSSPTARSFAVMSRKLEWRGGKWDDERRTLSWATYLSAEKSVASVRTFPHRRLVEVLNNWAEAHERLYLRIDHLPGSGVDKWLQRQDNEPVRELKAKHIVYRTLEYDWGKVESDHREPFRRLVSTMQELAESLDSQPRVDKTERWAVFHDRVLPRIDPEDHSEWLETVKKESQKQIGARGRFLYLVPRTQHASELTRLFPDAQPSPALDAESRDELLRSYDTVVPFRTKVLERLTGGCLGFGAQLLDEVQNQFVQWPDAKEILDADLEELIATALESGPMQQLTREFNHSIESLQGGHVLAYIRQKVLERQSGALSNMDKPVTFTFGELQKKLRDRSRLRAVLDVLISHGVIVKENGNEKYQVLALAPFLVKPQPTTPTSSGGNIKEKTIFTGPRVDGHVFISYSGRASARVLKELVSDLKARNVECWYDERLVEHGTEFHPEILAAIERARFAVLLLDGAFARSEYIEKHEWPAIRAAIKARRLEVFTLKVAAAIQKEEFEALVSLNGNEPLSLKRSARRRQQISEAAEKLIKRWGART